MAVAAADAMSLLVRSGVPLSWRRFGYAGDEVVDRVLLLGVGEFCAVGCVFALVR